jgi:metal-responsive CopG/Arc/MetJ family transcriptional regulator
MSRTTKTRIAVTLDAEVLKALDQERNLSRSKYINNLLYLSLATEQDLGLRRLMEK